MKAWKLGTIITIIIIGAAFITTSAFAFLILDNNAGASTRTTTAKPLTIYDAETIAEDYSARLGNPNLAVREVEEYSLNFYVQVYEKDTGVGAFELLVDKYARSIYPEMGPNMMWNTKYGPMANGMMGYLSSYGEYGYGGMEGMMGGWLRGTSTGTTRVTVDQARADAQQWLNANLAGTTVGEVSPFYGYYHVMVVSSGGNYGMLGVNGYTGQVWYHTWHGAFTQELHLN